MSSKQNRMTDANEEYISDCLQKSGELSSKAIHEMASTTLSYATVKRLLSKLVSQDLVTTIGQGRATKYKLSAAFEILRPIDIEKYFVLEVDERTIKQQFNFDLIATTLKTISLFTEDEKWTLAALQAQFENNIQALSPAAYKKEFERLAIDLSWKSSQIEGNTYSLLETELLLKEKQTAAGKTKDEATMLLNHKAALDFLLEDPGYIVPLSISKIEDIHSLLMNELGIDKNIRMRRVGISGTNYTPIDNQFQIKEAMTAMCELLTLKENVFEKALLALVLISYIQPFMDGNKRTARILSNAVLMHHQHCPISFRTVDSIAYKKAMLLFYEQNNLHAFKQIFIDQYKFAVEHYF
jgi:Fic family protein